MDILEYLIAQYPILVYIIGGLALAISTYAGYVKLTKGKADDARWDKIKNHKIAGPVIRLILRESKELQDFNFTGLDDDRLTDSNFARRNNLGCLICAADAAGRLTTGS